MEIKPVTSYESSFPATLNKINKLIKFANKIQEFDK